MTTPVRIWFDGGVVVVVNFGWVDGMGGLGACFHLRILCRRLCGVCVCVSHRQPSQSFPACLP
jgi:hypothetical protein